MKSPQISIILSTYNQPSWLEKALQGYEFQTFKDFEILIADDGSKDETRLLIENYKKKSKLKIKHIWHEDNGFQKTIILNKSIISSKSDYLLFSDGDCIPRSDFVEKHISQKEEKYFLSGGYFKLPLNISEIISLDDIKNQNCFDINWLKKNGLNSSIKNYKLYARGCAEKLLNRLTPTKATWNGHNSSAWKKDILNVNGFDERMQYGGEDRELGERMLNLGIRSKQLRYSAVCVHLDHARGYVKQEMIEKNNIIRKKVKRTKSVYTLHGIKKNSINC